MKPDGDDGRTSMGKSWQAERGWELAGLASMGVSGARVAARRPGRFHYSGTSLVRHKNYYLGRAAFKGPICPELSFTNIRRRE